MSAIGRRALVTGAGGFVGSHLVERLLEDGYSVRCFVRYTSTPRHGWLDDIPTAKREACEVVAGDLRDAETVQQATRDVDTIFHLGALVGVPYSYEHPREVVETNVLGTLNVLVGGRDQRVSRFVYASTSEVYGSAQYTPMDEGHRLHAQSPYAASKAGAEQLVESFHASYGLPTVVLRPFNIYGPRQSARAIIPTLITQVLTQSEIRLGNIATARDFTFVTDTIEALLLADRNDRAVGETMNVGSNSEVSIGDLAGIVATLAGKGRPNIILETDRVRPEQSEVQRLRADSSRIGDVLDWRPQIPLEEGLRLTIKWIEKHLSMYRAGQYET
jgi:dTDP-glucose 4,6-dehydratase